MMKFIYIFLCSINFVQSSIFDEFEAFKLKFNKSYSGEYENQYRFDVFQENLNRINVHNAEVELGFHTYTLGINQFADITQEEWIQRLTSFTLNRERSTNKHDNRDVLYLPDYVDWRDEGCVTSVKSQGINDGSWLYSSTGAIDGAVCIFERELLPMSNLNILDCCPSCKSVEDVYKYTIDNGVNDDEDYPPFPNDGTCKFDENKLVIHIKSYELVERGNEQDLAETIATKGPVSVLIDAGQFSFQLYSGGVYYEPNCNSWSLNHAVLAVGYGIEMGIDAEYYTVKNSWGSSWGEGGYIRMSRNRDNNCGIASGASYPIA